MRSLPVSWEEAPAQDLDYGSGLLRLSFSSLQVFNEPVQRAHCDPLRFPSNGLELDHKVRSQFSRCGRRSSLGSGLPRHSPALLFDLNS